MQAFEQYDNVEDLGLQCSPIILKVRPKISYKFDFYRTQVRSLAMLVTHSLPNSLTPVSKLDLCFGGYEIEFWSRFGQDFEV